MLVCTRCPYYYPHTPFSSTGRSLTGYLPLTVGSPIILQVGVKVVEGGRGCFPLHPKRQQRGRLVRAVVRIHRLGCLLTSLFTHLDSVRCDSRVSRLKGMLEPSVL